MSQQDERGMDQYSGPVGSIRRARERAEAGLPREPLEPPSPRRAALSPNSGRSLQTKDGGIGVTISRPSPVPQWPLAGPLPSPQPPDGTEPYRPPPGRPQQPPQRPPRPTPSKIPSMLDASRMQEHTPVFQYVPPDQRQSELLVPETPGEPTSRPSTISSQVSIPDFPLPTSVGQPPPIPPPRRSVTLGPPPSSRRGASSFYSTTSFVSPIPEESPRSRSYASRGSRASYASSAAIPESFGTISANMSPGLSPAFSSDGEGAFFDDTMPDESIFSDDADETQLVRSASIGRKGKPSLVTTRSSESKGEGEGESVPIVLEPATRPMLYPVQRDSVRDGTYLNVSSSSSGKSSEKTPVPVAVSADRIVSRDSMLNALEAAGAKDPSAYASMSPRPSRFSAIRRPPRLDIDAVRNAEARGSLTSLPDLIRRATRLASVLERGRRPASRFEDLEFPGEVYGRDEKVMSSYEYDKHQSGLSDMLAAFPPPAQANKRRSMAGFGSGRTSWPLPLGRMSFRGPPPINTNTARANNGEPSPGQPDQQQQRKQGRRCCGLPLWGFIVLVIILLVVIAAAIVIPLEFFVIQKQQNVATSPQSDLASCQSQVTCANGGTNVVADGVCSCICSNGFTGANCTVATSRGCTSANFPENNLSNVTLGDAIPRLLDDAKTNFSVTLSPTRILAKFNSANLSCITENALVTFDGKDTRARSLDSAMAEPAEAGLALRGAHVPRDVMTVEVEPGMDVTFTVEKLDAPSVITTTLSWGATTTLPAGSTMFSTTLTMTVTASPSTTTAPPVTVTPTPTTTATTPTSTGDFTISQKSLDFARVAVLFVLQEEGLQTATTAQTEIQKFLSSDLSVASARNVSIGAGNSVDFVDFTLDV